MTSQRIRPAANLTGPNSSKIQQANFGFLCSAFMFRMGLALVTFEQDRFFEIQLSDYILFLSLLLLLFSLKFRLIKEIIAGLSVGGVLILSGALLSLVNASNMNDAAGPLRRLFVLFVLFAALAVTHSKNIRTNIIFLLVGIFINCTIALIQASVFPGIVDTLSINPVRATDFGSSSGRFQGLTSHPNVLGLSVALAIFIGVGLLFSESNRYMRWGLVLQLSVCTIGAYLSGSRTFLFSLIPALLVLGLFQRQNHRAIVRTLVAVAVLWAALMYVAPAASSQYLDRLDALGLVDYGRLATAAQAVLEISEKPILGWGIDHFGEAGGMLFPGTDEVLGAHNSFLQYWYGAGLLGAIGFLALFAIPARQMLAALKMKPRDNSRNALSLGLGVYVLLFVVSNVQPILYNRFLYVPLFIFAGFTAHALGPIRACKPARKPVVHLPGPNIQATSSDRATEIARSE